MKMRAGEICTRRPAYLNLEDLVDSPEASPKFTAARSKLAPSVRNLRHTQVFLDHRRTVAATALTGDHDHAASLEFTTPTAHR